MRIKLLLVLLAMIWTSLAKAVPITINMTGDNILFGGLCDTNLCISGTNFGTTPNYDDWTMSDTISLDLAEGTHNFAWSIDDSGGPEGLLAEILWGGLSNVSSSAWEVYDIATGNMLETATELGANNAHPIWGTIAGISETAQWIWDSEGTAQGAESVWIRTSITVEASNVSSPAIAALFIVGLGLLLSRRVS